MHLRWIVSESSELAVSLEVEIVSIGYPGKYANNQDQDIRIYFAEDQFIVLRFIEFRLQNDICQGESCTSSNISCRSVMSKSLYNHILVQFLSISMTYWIYISAFREDRLTIFDYSHVYAQSTERIMCGSNPPHQIALISNTVVLNFHSDSSIGDTGFRIKIEKGK